MMRLFWKRVDPEHDPKHLVYWTKLAGQQALTNANLRRSLDIAFNELRKLRELHRVTSRRLHLARAKNRRYHQIVSELRRELLKPDGRTVPDYLDRNPTGGPR